MATTSDLHLDFVVHGRELWSFVYKFLRLFFSCTMYVYNKEEEKRKKKKKLL
jgi:hypothetical protein